MKKIIIVIVIMLIVISCTTKEKISDTKDLKEGMGCGVSNYDSYKTNDLKGDFDVKKDIKSYKEGIF